MLPLWQLDQILKFCEGRKILSPLEIKRRRSELVNSVMNSPFAPLMTRTLRPPTQDQEPTPCSDATSSKASPPPSP